MDVCEYRDDIVFFKRDSEKNSSNETIVEKVTMEGKTSEKDKNGKRNTEEMRPTFGFQNSVTKENINQPKEAQYEEALGQGGMGRKERTSQENEPMTPVQGQDKNNGGNEDQTQNRMEEEQKTQHMDSEGRSTEKKMQCEEIYETMNGGKNRTDIEKTHYEDISHGSVHDQMLKELHTRFLAMKHLHNL